MKIPNGLKSYDAWPGLKYDKKRKCAVLEGSIAGTDPRQRRKKTLKNVTMDEALAAWKVFRAELDRGVTEAVPRTIAEFVASHYDTIAKRHAASTRKTHRSIIKNHLRRFFADEPMAKISAVRVEDFIADMKGREHKGSFINDCVRVLKYILRQAVEREVLNEYPIKRRIEKVEEDELRQELGNDERLRFFDVFNDEDVFRKHIERRRKLGPIVHGANFSAARRHGGGLRGDSDAAGMYFARFRELRDFFIVAVETGLRTWSDLLNLRWSSIDFADGFMRVVMQKTNRVAEIPLSSACRDALRGRHARPVVSAFVFVDADGRQLSKTTLRRAFVLAKKLAGISRDLRPYDLRHTFGCRLAGQNVSLSKIKTALGHTTTRMSERYARPSSESMREIKSALDTDAIL